MVVVPKSRIITIHVPYELALHLESVLPKGESIEDHVLGLVILESAWAPVYGVNTLKEVQAKILVEARARFETLKSASDALLHRKEKGRDAKTYAVMCDHESDPRLMGNGSASDREVRD